MKVQYKLTDEMVLRSNVYLVLKEQCQYLMDYISDLLAKLKKHEEYLMVIEKNREEEIRDLKKKYEKNKLGGEKADLSPINAFQNSSNNFKTEALNLIKQLRDAYH